MNGIEARQNLAKMSQMDQESTKAYFNFRNQMEGLKKMHGNVNPDDEGKFQSVNFWPVRGY